MNTFATTGLTSIKDIAREAKVSHATVSRALRDSPLVNPETAGRIRQIAHSMGYRPSAVARSLLGASWGPLGCLTARGNILCDDQCLAFLHLALSHLSIHAICDAEAKALRN